MGYYIHCSTTYQVEYGEGYFSNHTAAINRLFYENSDHIECDCEDIECATHLKVPRADLANLIVKILNKPKVFDEWLDRNKISCTPEFFIKTLCEWIAVSDPRNEFVALTWF